MSNEVEEIPASGASDLVTLPDAAQPLNGSQPDNISAQRAVRVLSPSNPLYAFTFRNFRLFFVGQSISVAGTWMQTVAQQWLVWQLTHSSLWLGIVNGASAIPYVAFAMWGGQLADRHSRKTILLWTQWASMFLATILALLATNRWTPILPWHIVALSGISSIVNAFNMPAQQALVIDLVDERAAIGNAIALNSLRFNVARFLGPILAGIVLVKINAAACFALNALSFVAVIISLMMMRVSAPQLIEVDTSMWQGFRFIKENRAVFRTVILIGLAAFFTWPLSTLFPVFATKFHQGAQGYSGMMSANGIGAALGGVFLAWMSSLLPRRVWVYGGAILFSVSVLAFSAITHYFAALVCLVFGGCSMILMAISCNTFVQEQVPDELRGRVMAVYNLVFNGMFPLGGLEIGSLAHHYNPVNALRVNGLLCLIFTIMLLGWNLRDRPAKTR